MGVDMELGYKVPQVGGGNGDVVGIGSVAFLEVNRPLACNVVGNNNGGGGIVFQTGEEAKIDVDISDVFFNKELRTGHENSPLTLLKIADRNWALHVMPTALNCTNTTRGNTPSPSNTRRLDSVMIIACAVDIWEFFVVLVKEGLEFCLLNNVSESLVETRVTFVVRDVQPL